MNRLQCLIRLARALDYNRDPDPKHWKTINGAKVHLDKNGNYDGGAGGKFNGNHHYGGPDWKQKKEAVNSLYRAFSSVAKQKQAQGTAQGNQAGNTSSPNVASKATQNGGGNGTIKTEIKATNFPSEYNQPKEKKNMKIILSKLAEYKKNADPKTYELYSKFGELAKKTNAIIDVSHRGKCSVDAFDFNLGLSDKFFIITPSLDRKSEIKQQAGMSTWLHENMHAMDAMAGKIKGKGALLSKKDQVLTQAVNDAAARYRNTGSLFGVKSQKIVDQYTKERNKACDEMNRISTSFKNWYGTYKQKYLNGTLKTSFFYGHALTLQKYAEKCLKKRWDDFIDLEDAAGWGNLTDMYDAISDGFCHDILNLSGHGDYYLRHPEKRNSELLANWAALKVKHSNLAEIFQEEYPDIAKSLDRLIDEINKIS